MSDEIKDTSSPPLIPPALTTPSDALAVNELIDYSSGSEGKLRYGGIDWYLDIGLKVIFATAALAFNVWWDRHVLALIWQSGRINAGFHLADSVLIALVTTSVANFLALIAIVMRNLFPSKNDASPIKAK
jgi:hypothetical protein